MEQEETKMESVEITPVFTEEQKKLLAETAYNLGRAITEFVEIAKKAVENALKPIGQMMQELFDMLEPYQKFEMAHPRKKPRGSIRRARKERRLSNEKH